MSWARGPARSAYLVLASLFGFEARLLAAIRRRDEVVVLNLHRVSPDPNDFYPPLHPAAFDALLTFLKRHFTLTTFAGLKGAPAGRPTAVLSFDDGFHDFVEHAMPVLQRHGVRANQNVVVSSVLTGRPPWTQRMNDLLAAATPAALSSLSLPGASGPPPPSAAGRARYGAALGARLMQLRRAEREPLLRHLEERLGDANVRPTRMMNLTEVRDAARHHEIGAHSYAHDPMGAEDMRVFDEDVRRCDEFIREVLGHPLDIYAFPNGSHRPEQVRALADRGLRAILLVGDQYATRRGPVYPRFNVAARDPRALRLEALGARARILPI